jgi:hypothetical protein
MLVDNADKIQTQNFDGRAGHEAIVPVKTKQGPDQRICRRFPGFSR